MFEAELDGCRWGTKSLKKGPPANRRGRTHKRREGRAPENKSSEAVTSSNREGAGGFLKRKRERERAAKDDDCDGEQKGC